MVKIIIIIIVLCISSLIGFLYGEMYRKRPLDLKECYKAIMFLQNEVIFNNTPLPDGLIEIGEKLREPYSDLLLKVGEDLIKGNEIGVLEAFEKAFKIYEKDFYMQKEDKKIISEFLLSLGSSFIYGQEKVFKLCLENLKINIEEADTLAKKNTKLYRYLGVCIGAMIAILII